MGLTQYDKNNVYLRLQNGEWEGNTHVQVRTTDSVTVLLIE